MLVGLEGSALATLDKCLKTAANWNLACAFLDWLCGSEVLPHNQNSCQNPRQKYLIKAWESLCLYCKRENVGQIVFGHLNANLRRTALVAAHTWLEEVGTRQGQHVYNATTVIGFSMDYANLVP